MKQLKTHNNICLSVFLLSHLQLSATPWTVAHQAPLSMSAGVQLQQPGIQPEEMNGVRNEAASQFSFGLPVYFKFKILFYTFTKTLGQRFDIFSFLLPDLLSPQIIVALQSSCFSDSLGISLIILSTSSNVSCS